MAGTETVETGPETVESSTERIDQVAEALVAERSHTARPASRHARRAVPEVFGPAAPARISGGVLRGRPAARKARPARPAVRTPERVRVARKVRPAAKRVHRPARKARHVGARRGAGAVVAYAYAQIGKPYRFGAQGPRAFDCSGLTLRAFARAGRRLPHKAARQNGTPVSRRAARPGDLVKWGGWHVAVYVGRGFVIHAPKPGDHVRRVRLWGSYRIVRVL